MRFIRNYGTGNLKSDEELLLEFTSTGDLEKLGVLYSRYMHLVFGVCLKYLNDREDSKDAVMQIFEKLITDIPRQKIGTFRNWLYAVTKNYCLMLLRAQKTRNSHLMEWMTDSAVFMENGTEMHPLDTEAWNFDKALAACIEKLKGEQKQCIRQFYYENRCYKEIATNLEINEKKVKSHLQNAKRNLKLCLQEKHVRQL